MVDLEESILIPLLYNILPGGNTVLHKLWNKDDEILKIFKFAHSKSSEIKFHVPLLPNLNGETVLHKLIQAKNFQTVNSILKYLKLYQFDHHSRAIKDLLPVFIEKEFPELGPYIESRLLQTPQLTRFKKGCILKEKEEMPVITASLWFDEEKFKHEMFLQTKNKIVESRINCEMLDMPGIYHYLDQDFQEFFNQLATTETLGLFDLLPIQTIIDFNYKVVKEYVTKKLFIPYCFFLITYLVFLN